MTKRFLSFLRTNTLALVALFVALGGTTYAAAALPSNSVGAAQLKNGAVSSAKVKDHSLLAVDFGAGQLPQAGQGSPGQTGPQGPKGDKGDPGPTAGAFASTLAPISIVSNGPVAVLSLSTPNQGSSTIATGKLNLQFKGRVIVEANTTIYTNATSIHSGQCNLVLKDSAGHILPVGQYVFFNQSQVGSTDVHLTGAADEPAGTYDATLQCVADTSEAYRSDLVAFAVAR